MSILLESLKQSKKQEDNDIPSLSDSHFDDEMLSDEWLLDRVKLWKTAAFSLLSLLLLVLIAGYVYWPKVKTLPAVILPSLAINETNVSSNADSIFSTTSDTGESDLSAPVIMAAGNLISSDPKEQKIAKYQPKIVERPFESQDHKEFSTQKNQANKQATISTGVQSNITVSFESLNAQEKREFPELAINSYAVSSNPAKSFVVLNDAFYSEGETIAPHLKLVLIDDDGIVVSYKNRLVRKKHEL